MVRVSNIGLGISEYGDAFAAWLSYDTSQDPLDTSVFLDAYLGEWDSLRAYAEDFAGQTGLYDAAEQVHSPYVTVDVDLLERDLDIELFTVESGDGTVFVFDPNA